MSLEMILLCAALLVVFVLAVIAGRLLSKVHVQNKAQQLALDAQEKSTAEQRRMINNSIQILAQATQSGELTLTEAAIRIAGLLDSLGVSDEVRNEFSAFYQLRDLTSHIPILANWKKLSRKEQKEFDLQRLKHEAAYNDFILDAATRIRGREF